MTRTSSRYEPRTAMTISPHPDDDVLGAGGLMASLSESGWRVSATVVTRAQSPRFAAEFGNAGISEARVAYSVLGVEDVHFLDFPLAELDMVSHADVNARLLERVRAVRPELLLIPFGFDLMLDHQLVSLSSLVASRPNSDIVPRTILAYETLSQTNWNSPYTPRFSPTAFADISNTLERKVAALECFKSQMKSFPHERSVQVVRSLAMVRGAEVMVDAAEAFVTVRTEILCD